MTDNCSGPGASAGGLEPASASVADADVISTGGRANADRPFLARVVANERLSSKESHEVRHIALNIAGSGLIYAPGDALAVQPCNPEHSTRLLLSQLNLDATRRLRVTPALPHAPPLRAPVLSVLELFTRHLDVFGVPRRSFFALLAHFATEPLHRERLQEFGDAKVSTRPSSMSPRSLPTATRPPCVSIISPFPRR